MPLVLHGGTGIPADMIKKAIDLGVSKINVNTECQLSFAAATRKYVEEGKDQQGKGYDPRKLLAPGFELSKKQLKKKWNYSDQLTKPDYKEYGTIQKPTEKSVGFFDSETMKKLWGNYFQTVSFTPISSPRKRIF